MILSQKRKNEMGREKGGKKKDILFGTNKNLEDEPIWVITYIYIHTEPSQ
jgi:hypothetical protein